MKGKCPRADELQAIAIGKGTSLRGKRHVESCPVCWQIVADFRRDADLLSKLRQATTTGPDDDTRQRIQEICDRIARQGRREGVADRRVPAKFEATGGR